MESWRRCLRVGFLPQLSTPGLHALALALRRDDPRLLQGATIQPPPLQSVQDWPVEAADPFAYAVWQGDYHGEATVEDIEDAWAARCFYCDAALGEPGGCRWALNWWDENPRQEVIPALLQEVLLELKSRRTPEEVIAAIAAGEGPL